MALRQGRARAVRRVGGGYGCGSTAHRLRDPGSDRFKYVILPIVLIVAGVAAAVRLDDTVLRVLAIATVVVQVAALRRTQRFSARFARALPLGRRSRRARATELVYAVSALAGVVLLAWSFLD